MANVTRTAVMISTTESAKCRHSWCNGRICAPNSHGERFHRGVLGEFGDGPDRIGVELVRNDNPDATSSGTFIEITWSDLSSAGLTVNSATLSAAQGEALSAVIAAAARLALR